MPSTATPSWYFANYVLHRSDVTIDLATHEVEYARSQQLPPWRVTLVDTGSETQTGGRLRRIGHLLAENETFCMTYGDGVSDLDIRALVAFHETHGLDATLTAVLPPGRFGATVLDGHRVVRFAEKPAGDGGYINGGFFVLSKRVLDRIQGEETLWEREPMEGLARDGQLAAFVHKGFWQPMDTLRDKNHLEELWRGGSAPWKTWSD
jgi:glucose-1-phosphate cytidylyltransferase